MPSGEEIQRALRAFSAKWADYTGSEKSEAQTFLNELFACYGTDRFASGAKFEHFAAQAGFMDLLWPGTCIVEMKAPTVPVSTAQQQVERYWRESGDFDADVPAARFIVICNFRQLEIWDFARHPNRPRATIELADLPDRYEALAFLAGPTVEPGFTQHHRELTREAATVVAEVFASLAGRHAAPPRELQRFVLQSVWCMFAEDLQMLGDYPFTATLAEVRRDPDRSAAEVGLLFRVLNRKGKSLRTGRLAGTRYVNGELFAQPAEVGLNRAEIDLLLQAAEFDWRKVNPTIFGSLLEGVLGKERRWEIGAHYTHEVDIMKIVGPTIVKPWRERIEQSTTPGKARALLDELVTFKVLDPACGCGNFLYIAYRELRALEAELKVRIRRMAEATGLPVPAGDEPFYPLTNLQGLDIERSAVEIAKVTLWMGHRQMIEEFGEAEAPLPLQSLPGLRQADALRTPWPQTDCIIGNPPFLGSQHIRSSMGDDYVEWLKRQFGVGVKDFCTYWFRRSVEHLRPGQRAGLVATNSVAQNRARSVSLDYIMESGGAITDAVKSQVWPGEAAVHVSIVNWVSDGASDLTRVLNGIPVAYIRSNLTAGGEVAWVPKSLKANQARCFQGPIPAGAGFVLDQSEAESLLADAAVDYSLVIKPYLTASDITNDPAQNASRWIVDFAQMPLQEAMRFPKAIDVVRERVRPFREGVNRERHRRIWWQFAEPRVGMRQRLERVERSAVIAAHAKRFNLAVVSSDVLPSNACMVAAFDDDYALGILLSRAHVAWAWAQASTLKGDLRYTPTSVFMTFAWPDPTVEQREAVAEASRRLLARRSEICTTEQVGLTTLYNAVDDGAWTDLADLHRTLDRAVAACYGWAAAVAQDDEEIVSRLTELNRQISDGELPYAPFA